MGFAETGEACVAVKALRRIFPTEPVTAEHLERVVRGGHGRFTRDEPSACRREAARFSAIAETRRSVGQSAGGFDARVAARHAFLHRDEFVEEAVQYTKLVCLKVYLQ